MSVIKSSALNTEGEGHNDDDFLVENQLFGFDNSSQFAKFLIFNELHIFW